MKNNVGILLRPATAGDAFAKSCVVDSFRNLEKALYAMEIKDFRRHETGVTNKKELTSHPTGNLVGSGHLNGSPVTIYASLITVVEEGQSDN